MTNKSPGLSTTLHAFENAACGCVAKDGQFGSNSPYPILCPSLLWTMVTSFWPTMTLMRILRPPWSRWRGVLVPGSVQSVTRGSVRRCGSRYVRGRLMTKSVEWECVLESVIVGTYEKVSRREQVCSTRRLVSVSNERVFSWCASV